MSWSDKGSDLKATLGLQKGDLITNGVGAFDVEGHAKSARMAGKRQIICVIDPAGAGNQSRQESLRRWHSVQAGCPRRRICRRRKAKGTRRQRWAAISVCSDSGQWELLQNARRARARLIRIDHDPAAQKVGLGLVLAGSSG